MLLFFLREIGCTNFSETLQQRKTRCSKTAPGLVAPRFILFFFSLSNFRCNRREVVLLKDDKQSYRNRLPLTGASPNTSAAPPSKHTSHLFCRSPGHINRTHFLFVFVFLKPEILKLYTRHFLDKHFDREIEAKLGPRKICRSAFIPHLI